MTKKKEKTKTVGYFGCVIAGYILKSLYNALVAPHTKRKEKIGTWTMTSILWLLGHLPMPKLEDQKETYTEYFSKIKKKFHTEESQD